MTTEGNSLESPRLTLVSEYDILDTEPEPAFDCLTRLAACHYEVPTALVSIVDLDRIWFKSRHGFERDQIPRQIGFCGSAIHSETPLVVSDASKELWASKNTLIADDGYRFYAGVPLRTAQGLSLGTVCILDRNPRQLQEKELSALRDLACLAMDALESRLIAKRESERHDELFTELHHRVKNNLQVVSSLLSLQASSSPSDTTAAITDSLKRVHSISLLHGRFYKKP